MSHAMDQIVIPPPGLSLGADIYREYRLGHLSWIEYLTANAAAAGDNASTERPKIYLPMPRIAREYADCRIAGAREHEQAPARVLGQWRYDVFKAMDHNQYMIEHFEWARERCLAVALGTHVEQFTDAIARFEAHKFPYAEYGLACTVLKMDSDDRERITRRTA